MGNEKIIDNSQLEKILNDFCKENHLSIDLFEIAKQGNGKGSGPRKVLKGPEPTAIKNKKCTYVIKLFLRYNIIIIWNYKNNPNMSYPYLTLKEKLDNGIREGDKGYGYHPHKQSRVLFEYTENIKSLLSMITDKK